MAGFVKNLHCEQKRHAFLVIIFLVFSSILTRFFFFMTTFTTFSMIYTLPLNFHVLCDFYSHWWAYFFFFFFFFI